MIRHLVMPNNLADSDKILQFIGNDLSKDTYVNIMAQYYPEHQALDYPELSHGLKEHENRNVMEQLKNLG